MLSIPQIEPVTGLSRDYKGIFAKLEKGPVFLAQRSKPAAVLLSMSEYENMVQRLKHLELLVETKRIMAEMASDPNSIVPLAELKRRIAQKANV